MQIESILLRDGGTKTEVGGKTYHFRPHPEKGITAHIAEVTEPTHIQRFLSITEGYRPFVPEVAEPVEVRDDPNAETPSIQPPQPRSLVAPAAAGAAAADAPDLAAGATDAPAGDDAQGAGDGGSSDPGSTPEAETGADGDTLKPVEEMTEDELRAEYAARNEGKAARANAKVETLQRLVKEMRDSDDA
jgi:hypothetical protein